MAVADNVFPLLCPTQPPKLQQQQSEKQKETRDDMMVRSSHVWEALSDKDQELHTADLLYKLGQSKHAVLSVKHAQKLTGFIDCKRGESEKMVAKQLEEEKSMQEQNNKLNSLL